MIDSETSIAQLHAQMREAEIAVDEQEKLVGVDELDAVVTAEVAALVVEPVRIADRVAFLGIDHERGFAFGEPAVRHDVDAVVADQPETGPLAVAGLEP
jgi:hypothetical protein